jgi:coenzyme F420-reducing hydrogenase beta subunit
LERLLATGEVDRVGVVSCEADGTQGFRFVVREAQSIDETRRAAGSVYHQVEIADILRRIASNPDLRWAVTGVPCLCAAMRRAMGRAPTLRRSVRYLLGLACGMYQNTFYTELLLAESGVDRNRVTRIEYRGQPDEGSASNYRFRASDDRRSGTAIAYHGLPYYLGFNAFFRVNSCNSCMDVFAEGADACFMDAWLPEYRNEPRGTSLVLVRNPAIRRLLGQSIAKTGVCLNEIGIDKVIASQQMHVLRKRYLIHMRKGEKVNRFTHRPFALSDRVAWFVQRYAQRRSKNAWATAGRSRGHRAFWRAAWDVVLLVKAESCARRLARQLRALARLGR